MIILPFEPQVPTKFCVNCKWYQNGYFKGEKCTNPKNVTLDPVTGKPKYKWLPSTLRTTTSDSMIEKYCCVEGKWYEPK